MRKRNKQKQQAQLQLIESQVQVAEQSVHHLLERKFFPVTVGATSLFFEIINSYMRQLLIALGRPRDDFFFTNAEDSQFNKSRLYRYLMTAISLYIIYRVLDIIINWYFSRDFKNLQNNYSSIHRNKYDLNKLVNINAIYQKELKIIRNKTTKDIKNSLGLTLAALLATLFSGFFLFPKDGVLRPSNLLYKIADFIFAAILFSITASSVSILTYISEYINNYRRKNALINMTKQLNLEKVGLVVSNTEEEHLFIITSKNGQPIEPKSNMALTAIFKACNLTMHNRTNTRMIVSIPPDAKISYLNKAIVKALDQLNFINIYLDRIAEYNKSRKGPIIIDTIFELTNGYNPSLSIYFPKNTSDEKATFFLNLKKYHDIKLDPQIPFSLTSLEELDRIINIPSQQNHRANINVVNSRRVIASNMTRGGTKVSSSTGKVPLFTPSQTIQSKQAFLKQNESISYINPKGQASNWQNTGQKPCHVFCIRTQHNKHRLFIISQSDLKISHVYMHSSDLLKPEEYLFSKLTLQQAPMAPGTHGGHFQQWRQSTHSNCRSIKLRAYGASSSGKRFIYEESAPKSEIYFYHAVTNHNESKQLHSSTWKDQQASITAKL